MTGLCWVCFRSARGFSFSPTLVGERGLKKHFCSRNHQLLSERVKLMTDWTAREDEIIWEGVRAGGEYLDSLNQTDLAILKREELITFAKCILQRVVEERLAGVNDLDDDIPF